MGKKVPYTPNSQIRNAIRKLFLQSRERRRCLKGALCKCGSNIKIEAHHTRPINWERVIRVIREEVLNDSLIPLCKECHAKETRRLK